MGSKKKSYNKRKYKNFELTKILTILGGVLGVLLVALSLAGYDYSWSVGVSGLESIIRAVVGLIISVVTIAIGMKLEDTLPLHWLIIFIFAVLLIIFASLWAGILLIIAGLIAIIDAL